ncbi:MAG: aldehyde ferredoxin oxidoreductase family protein [Chloroflexi bacterium]|jgi:aldehyde:ferredoxin oxidoreductase|nr:aldehyde ferredoxin oxidoreductase family protein [Chloroflexota bacterium]
MDGWVGRIIRVDLSGGDFIVEDLDPYLAMDYIGGRGLGTKILYDEVDPQVDPLSPENKLIFMTCPLTGTGALGGNRFAAVTKSPLTGTVTCPNAGGNFGPELKFAGYDGIIFEGKAPNPVYLWINNDEIEIRSAEHLWGKTVNETEDVIREEIGDKWQAMDTHIACIGPAGERLVRIAAIMTDRNRVLGRGGAGAVMGSKNLKAIAVRGTGAVTVADGEAFKEATMALWENIPPEGGPVADLGMMAIGESSAMFGILATRNFQAGTFEGWGNINGPALKAQYLVRNKGCFACCVPCARVYRVDDVEGFECAGEGAEFETHAMLGAACGVDNLAAVLKAGYICNDLGMDSISMGGTIACAVELYERGYLPEKDVGYKLNFGNAQAVVELVEKTGLRQDFGDILAEGGYRMAEKYGHPELSMSVKKMEMPAWHVQGVQGTGLEYATCNRGADHMKACMFVGELLYSLSTETALQTEGKAAGCIESQHRNAVVDSIGLCTVVLSIAAGGQEGAADPVLPAVLSLLEPATGVGYTLESLMLAGERIWNLERLFNLAAGITAEDDTLPRRILEEPQLSGPWEGAVNRLGEMLPEYYQLRGWTEEGVPSLGKLEELGLA